MSLASAVGVSRVLGFRHWPSDVLASALLGIAFGWFFANPLPLSEAGDDSSGAGLEGDVNAQPASPGLKGPTEPDPSAVKSLNASS